VWIIIVVVIVGLPIAAYVGFRRGAGWLLARYDRALRKGRDRLDPQDELPRYLPADLTTRWPGWDGWYVLAIPRDHGVPIKAIRVSIMTGLYGLDGIDNYQELQGLSPFEVVEYLMMLQTDSTSHLFRRYLPKQTDLAIRREQLLVSVKDWGEISGQWPDYQVQMRDPTAGIEVSLTYTAKHLIWWADLPRLFTYVAAFGDIHGTISLGGQEYALTGEGAFEHGFARKPFHYDALLKPLRGLQKLFRFSPIHYHYNLLISPDGWHGGMMLAQGVGVDFRNLGGLYFADGRFMRLSDIAVEDVELEELQSRSSALPISFPKSWRVRAKAHGGLFAYSATRESPAAHIAREMIYFDFRFTGIYRELGKPELPFTGHGYGEYVRL
jgi:hypothetical protein